jgi:LysM repeat protein
LKRYIFYIITVVSIVITPSIYSQEQEEMSQKEWEILRDDYAVQIIILMKKLEGINNSLDSLSSLDSAYAGELEKKQEELYALVGLTSSSIIDFRNKFEMTENKIHSRISSPADSRLMYFDEISNSMARCLPEFSERYASIKKQLAEWEGFQPLIAESKTQEQENEETAPHQPISEAKEEQMKNIQTITEKPEVSQRTYSVVKGDCLRKIAELKYNSAELWPLIWLANKDGIVNGNYFYNDFQRAILNPDKIYPGQILYIPVISQKMKKDIETFEKRIK